MHDNHIRQAREASMRLSWPSPASDDGRTLGDNDPPPYMVDPTTGEFIDGIDPAWTAAQTN